MHLLIICRSFADHLPIICRSFALNKGNGKRINTWYGTARNSIRTACVLFKLGGVYGHLIYGYSFRSSIISLAKKKERKKGRGVIRGTSQ
jgi:hypothetical protein